MVIIPSPPCSLWEWIIVVLEETQQFCGLYCIVCLFGYCILHRIVQLIYSELDIDTSNRHIPGLSPIITPLNHKNLDLPMRMMFFCVPVL